MTQHVSAAAGRRRTSLIVTAGFAALAMLAWLAVGQTRAAFTDTTTNENNTFETGTVTLEDNDTGTVMFSAEALLPGQSVTGTIDVINKSPVPLGVRLYAANPIATGPGTELAANLDVLVTIEDNQGGADDVVFDGTMAQFAAFDDWADGQWACADAEACDDAPAPVAEDPTPVTDAIKGAIPEEQHEEVPEPVWTAASTADGAVNALQAAGASAPETVKTAARNAVDGVYTELVANWPEGAPTEQRDALKAELDELLAPAEDDDDEEPATGCSVPSGGDPLAPVNNGDRFEADAEACSTRTYTITVTMQEDAGGADIHDDDTFTIDFVWEGRA